MVTMVNTGTLTLGESMLISKSFFLVLLQVIHPLKIDSEPFPWLACWLVWTYIGLSGSDVKYGQPSYCTIT